MISEELFSNLNITPDCEMLVDDALTNLYDVLDYLSSTRDEADPAYQWLLPVEEKLKKALKLFGEDTWEQHILCKDTACKHNFEGMVCMCDSLTIDKKHKCVSYCKKA